MNNLPRVSRVAALGLFLSLLAVQGFAGDAKQGAAAYKLCASCHGFAAEGNQLVNAPALAGQESWYLRRQINNFKVGIRGSSGDDAHGQTMALMTMGLDEDDIEDIVAFLDGLPAANTEATVVGDVAKGEAGYLSCAACHGFEAKGNEVLAAPALAGMDDWYQLTQMQKFKAGQRGNAPGDIYGMQMAPMVAMLPDEQAMIDVVAYINSLR